MIIVFVADSFLSRNDGTHISASRFREELIRRGHTVRVLGIGVDGPDMYAVEEHWVPFVSWISRKNNMHFAKFNRKTAEEAFRGADIVHILFPFQMARKCLSLAREMNIPVTAAFHCQAENVTYNLHINFLGFANTFVYFLFRRWFYRKVTHIHCPSAFTAEELKRHQFGAKMHVISNGIPGFFRPAVPAESWNDGKFHILMTGRLSAEKCQDLLIKAVLCSKYRDIIQLHFVGRGPMYRYYARLGALLPNPPLFTEQFISQEELLQKIHRADLYVHTSDVELESLACLEAIACGRVPVISDSKKSAASQFALDSRSVFRRGDPLDLCGKIDWWIEHPQERETMSAAYAALGRSYSIETSTDKLEAMFQEARIRDDHIGAAQMRDSRIRKSGRRGGRKPKTGQPDQAEAR